MRRGWLFLLAGIVGCLAALLLPAGGGEAGESMETMALPNPELHGGMPLQEAIRRRESVRDFGETSVGWREIGQLLWAAQGVTRSWGGRTSPSAGAVYPLAISVVRADGVYRYRPATHDLVRLSGLNRREALASAALGQRWVRNAPAVFVLCGIFSRMEKRYGRRAERYVWIEAGHCAQNLMLQAVSLGLGSVAVGAFDDHRVHSALNLPAEEMPLYLVPVGPQRK